MPDRTINWGDSQLDAKYQTGDSDPTGGDFVVAQRADGSQVLLQWNDTAGQWESTGDVDLGGNNLNSVGTATVSALEADSINITAVESGTITIAAGVTDVQVTTAPNNTYHQLFYNVESGGDTSRFDYFLSPTGGETVYRGNNNGGSDITINYRVVEVSQ